MRLPSPNSTVLAAPTPAIAASIELQFFQHGFLVRNRDAQAPDAQGRGVVQKLRQVLARHAERHVHGVDAQAAKRGVVDQRAEAVADRVADHAVDRRLRVDAVVVVDFGHLLIAELARRQRPLVMKRGVRERRAEPAGQNARRRADVAHAHADRRHFRALHQLQHPQIVVRLVGHRGDLDDVGVERRQPGVNLLQVVGRLAEIVQADDPLGLAVTRDHRGDVFFQIDVLDPLGDRAAQQHQPLFFGAR